VVIFIAATMVNSPHTKIQSVNKQVYSMAKIVSVTQYVFLIMLKWCNIYEFDYEFNDYTLF